MSALVLKQWKLGTKPVDDKNNFVIITGRESGLIAWILSLMRVDPTTTIKVGLERIEFSSSSLAGTQSRLIPLQGVCSSYYGYHKPWKAALSIIMLSLFVGSAIGNVIARDGNPADAFMPSLLSFAAGFAIAVFYYFFNRTMTLGFVENSGISSGIQFKRSVIENVDINEEQAKQVCFIVQKLIEAKEKRGAAGS